jgi:ferritin-like metal-binding protein YciE
MLTRGVTGYCAVKGALAGDMPFGDGVKQQFRLLRHAVSSTTVSSIDDLHSLYVVELQELHSAESLLAGQIERLAPNIQNDALRLRLEEYATELQSRRVDLESLLARTPSDTRSHPDDAMRALLGETQKMALVCAPALRDAALTASIQRIVHYKIAGYGTIGAYAKSLGRVEEAAHFAELADRDKAIDRDLTRLAKGTINPEAATSSEGQMPASLRTH